jgi:AraC-like DNA-binding protein
LLFACCILIRLSFKGRFADDQYDVSPMMPACNIFRWQGAKAGSREPEIHVADLRSDRAVSGQNGLVVLSLAIEVDRPVPIRQSIELGIGFLHRSFQQLFREHWKPEAVCFTHAAPAKRDVYRKFFGTEVRFSQDFNGIICASADLDAPVPAADSKMVRLVKQYLDTLTSRRNTTMSATVRECIYTMLPSGLCSADSVAARLGIDRRTVHRHLQREGTTFSALIDSVRTELVTRYVENRDRPLASCGAAWVFRPQRLLAMVSRSVWLQRVGVAREPRGASGLTRARARSVTGNLQDSAIWSNAKQRSIA